MNYTPEYKIYKDLCDTIIEHNHHYFVDMTPIISDDDYDSLVLELITLESHNPVWVTDKSPSQDPQLRIDTTSSKLIHNITQVLPEKEFKDLFEVQNWMSTIKMLLQDQNLKFTIKRVNADEDIYIASYRGNRCTRVAKYGTRLMSSLIPGLHKQLPLLAGQKFSNFSVLGRIMNEEEGDFMAEEILSKHSEIYSTHREHRYLNSVGFTVNNLLLVTEGKHIDEIVDQGTWRISVMDDYISNQLNTSTIEKKSSILFTRA